MHMPCACIHSMITAYSIITAPIELELSVQFTYGNCMLSSTCQWHFAA